MGLSEIITAIATVGISSLILALVKLLQFFRDSNKQKVDDILTRVDDDNKRWYTRYQEAQDAQAKAEKALKESNDLATKYRIELILSGISEERLEKLEEEVKDDGGA